MFLSPRITIHKCNTVNTKTEYLRAHLRDRMPKFSLSKIMEI